MPFYTFTRKGEFRDIFFKMNDDKIYIDENGFEWKRVFVKPNASIDTKWDATSSHDFLAKTGSKRGTVGDLWEKSQELSEKREKTFGRDEVKEQYYKNYSKERNGAVHNDVRKRNLKEKMKKNSWFDLK